MNRVALDSTGELLLFECPGCKEMHKVRVKSTEDYPCWEWNGSLEYPTCKSSLLVLWGHNGKSKLCHSFITDGKMQFLADSVHELAGQTVEMPFYE